MNWFTRRRCTCCCSWRWRSTSDLPDVPLVIDLAKTDEQRQILRLIFARQALGRPFLAPPGVPQDRAAALRKAFMDTMKDKAFLAEAEKAKLEITPFGGDAVQNIIAEPPRPTRNPEEGRGDRSRSRAAGSGRSAEAIATVRPPGSGPLTARYLDGPVS